MADMMNKEELALSAVDAGADDQFSQDVQEQSRDVEHNTTASKVPWQFVNKEDSSEFAGKTMHMELYIKDQANSQRGRYPPKKLGDKLKAFEYVK